MARILLTNDDGKDAPGLPSFARALAAIGDVFVVVPDRERSWVAKAITRFDPVTVTRTTVGGVDLMATSGFPADCVQLGVHTLSDTRPDLVVSGINIGYNHGSAYLQSSGTAGAALEAAIAGVPAIAFSTGSHVVPWREWKEHVLTADALPTWERLAGVAARLVEEALPLARPGDVLNVGLPDDATTATPRRRTRVAPSGYDRLFAEQSPGVYVHAYGGLVADPDQMNGTDVAAAADGVISITAIRGAGDGDRGGELANALAR
jgi:5'/3'-nucleotidase SurE